MKGLYMPNWKINLLILFVFTVVTAFMTYPVILNMHMNSDALIRSADPLLITWILSWNIHQISSLNFKNLFNANIFYPLKGTLAFSEHFLVQSVIALPVFHIFKNPILVFNYLYLLSFITSAFGMYLLTKYLTQSPFSGFIAGLIFAFSPFMFDHRFHLQILAAGGIPLAFLYLHKFFKDQKYKYILLFSLFFILQALANNYYALYLTLFSGLFILYQIIEKKLYKDLQFWKKMGLCVLIIIIVVGPIFFQYYKLQKDWDFSRKMGSYAGFKSFLAAPPINLLYGKITAQFRGPEAQLFPGLLAIILGMIGIISCFKNKKRKNLTWIYLGIMVLSFVLTFGPKGPYILLYKFVPGFNAIRAVARIHIFVMFSLAVFASFGISSLLRHQKWIRKTVLGVIISIVILLEYLSIPLALSSFPVKLDIPEVYKWLAEKRKEDFAIIEFPLARPGQNVAMLESIRMYYSTYHQHKLVNGYSGFIPPLYREMQNRYKDFPVGQIITDLKELNVKYMILHSSLYDESEFEEIGSHLQRIDKEILFVGHFDEAYVYELIIPCPIKPAEPMERLPNHLKSLWKANSNSNYSIAANAFDENISTRWHTDIQKKGDFFKLDLGRLHNIQGISMNLGTSLRNFPRGYLVETSSDGKVWKTAAQADQTVIPITAFSKPGPLYLDIIFSPRKCRYIKITNLGESDRFYWSFQEIEVYK